MNIIDSSGWLEYFTDGANAEFFSRIILDRSKRIIIPSIIIYEVFKKILTDRDEATALKTVAQLQKYQIESIDEGTAMAAAKISAEHKIPMADSMIYAVARKYKAVLWTQDEHLKGLPDVKYTRKDVSN